MYHHPWILSIKLKEFQEEGQFFIELLVIFAKVHQYISQIMLGCWPIRINFSYLLSKYQNLFIIGRLMLYLCSLFLLDLENVVINFYLSEILAFFPFKHSFSYPICQLLVLKVHLFFFMKTTYFLNSFPYLFLFYLDLH